MIKTYRDLITYCENFQYSVEYYELYKEASELDLMNQYITSQQYAAYVESSDLMDEILMEAIDPEKLKRIVTNFGVKASEFGSKIVQKLKDLIPKVIKFFKTYANKLFKKQHKFDINKFRNIVKSSPKDLAIYKQALKEANISDSPNGRSEWDDDAIINFIGSIINNDSMKLYDASNSCKGLANPKDIANLLSKVTFGNKSRTDRRLVKLTNSITILLDRSEIDKQCTDLEIALDSLTKNIDHGMLDTSDRGAIVQQIISRKIRGEDAIRNLWKRKEINSQRIGNSYDKKRPESEWNDNYLTKLFYSVVAESFNLDFLLYVDKVAEYVSRRNPARIIRANHNATKYNTFDQVDALKQLYQITASTLDFYNRFAKLYDQTIKLVNEILE